MKFDRNSFVASALSAPPACITYASGVRVSPKRWEIDCTRACSSGI